MCGNTALPSILHKLSEQSLCTSENAFGRQKFRLSLRPLQLNNYLDELAVPSQISSFGRDTDKALIHTYENARDFLRKGFGMQVRVCV